MSNYTDRISMIRQRAFDRKMLVSTDNPIGIKAGLWPVGRKAEVKPKDSTRPLEVTCYANTAAVDLEREVVVPSGLDVRSYLGNNKNLFVDHRYDVLSAVAVCRSMTLDPSGWLCRGVFHEDMSNPYVKACVVLARAGTLAMSVGFEALDWGAPTVEEAKAYPGVESVVRKARVLEVSYTAMPMNVTCRQVATNIDTANETAEKCRKAMIDAKIPDRVVQDFGIKPRRTIVVR
jgi:hypothetical protein